MVKLTGKIKGYLFKNWRLVGLIILGLAFVFTYSFLAISMPSSWYTEPKLILNSPDETSNLFFSRQLAEGGGLELKDNANRIVENLVSPRSMWVIKQKTVPAGFIGLPIIYGSLAKIFSVSAIPYFTPILAVLGVIFFYLLISKIFNKNVAFIASAFVYIFPGFWYYSTKSLMPNVAFLSLFIIALYFFLLSLNNKKLIYYILFAFILGLSLMIRTSEIVWLVPLFIVLLLFNFKKLKFWKLLISFIVLIIAFSPVFYFNNQIYGQPLSVGYAINLDLGNKNILEQGIGLMEKIFLPFGFHPKTAFRNLYNYTYGIFPIWFFFMDLGFLFLLFTLGSRFKDSRKKSVVLYILLLLIIGLYLTIYYGSWVFNDNPDPNAITIGTSYIRYWLPIYVFSLPLLAYLLIYLFPKKKIYPAIISILVWLLLFVSSYQLVMNDPDEGIVKVNQNIQSYQTIAAEVIKQTEDKAIIIAERMDKVFFPARSVIYKLNNDYDYARINQLIEAGYPIYLFDFTREEEELNMFNQVNYEPHGLKVSAPLINFEKQSLYRIVISN